MGGAGAGEAAGFGFDYGLEVVVARARCCRRQADEKEHGVRSSIVAFAGVGFAVWLDPFASNSVVRFTM